MVSYLKHPMVLALTGLIAVLVPGLALLTQAFDEARDRYFDSSLPAVPTETEIAAIARRLSPEETVLRLTGNVHAPDSPLRSGLVRVDAATDDRGGEYYVAPRPLGYKVLEGASADEPDALDWVALSHGLRLTQEESVCHTPVLLSEVITEPKI